MDIHQTLSMIAKASQEPVKHHPILQTDTAKSRKTFHKPFLTLESLTPVSPLSTLHGPIVFKTIRKED